MFRSASKIGDKSSARKETSFRSRRSVSVDTRARGSYVPDKRRPSSEERKSGNKLLRWTGNRKSSINLSDAKRKDVRPLTDKAYQKKKVSELVTFLEDTGFSPPIATSKLMSPSKKEFENIFQFLYRFFDPGYEVKKIEEEGPKILKNLNYPFSVNKSAFIYVARTNWPNLLGVLIWLMDLTKFAMKIDMKSLFETTEDDENGIHKIVVRFICQCHHSRIDNEENENAVFTEIVKSSVCKDLDELIAKNEEKKLLVASVEKEINESKSLGERDISLDQNIEKYEDYISKMKSHFNIKNELCEKLIEELKLKESNLKILQDDVSKKQDAYDAQGFDGKKHLNFFKLQKRDLAEKLEEKRVSIKDLQDKYWESEIEYKKISDKVAAVSEAYRELHVSIIESLRDILDPLLNIKTPQIQKLCDNFRLDFPHCEIHPDGHNVQSSTAGWKNIAARIKSTEEILKRIFDSLNQKLTEIEMKKSEASMNLQLLSFEQNKQVQDLNSKKKIVNDEISAFEVQCAKIREAIETLEVKNADLEKTYREMVEEKDI